ncbi:MAG: SBBP repeat-containing protein [Planctomycetota bacterium]|jgi:hypothetical protein
MKYTILVISVILSFSSEILQGSQNYNFEWANQITGSINDNCIDVAINDTGDVFVTGSFRDTLTVGNKKLQSKDKYNTFLIKYNSDGKLIWAKSSNSNYFNVGLAISLDDSGNCFLIGTFYDSVSFDECSLASRGECDVFIIKFNTDGNVIWGNTAGGIDADSGFAIAVDKSGDIFVAGSFMGTAQFDSMTVVNNSNEHQVFLAKYDVDGRVIWVADTGVKTKIVQGAYITVDDIGNCFITTSIDTLTTDIFIAKYTSNGSLSWSKTIDSKGKYSTTSDYSEGIATDSTGNVYVAGNFGGTLNFAGNSYVCDSSISSHRKIFLAKLDSNSNELWAKKVCGAYYGAAKSKSISTDKEGNVIATGFFKGTITIEDVTLESKGGEDIFISKYDGSGNLLWAFSNGGTSNDRGIGIATNNSGSIALLGGFRDTVTFGTTTLTSPKDRFSIFISKLKNIQETTSQSKTK